MQISCMCAFMLTYIYVCMYFQEIETENSFQLDSDGHLCLVNCRSTILTLTIGYKDFLF